MRWDWSIFWNKEGRMCLLMDISERRMVINWRVRVLISFVEILDFI